MCVEQKVQNYVEGYFLRHHMTKWPSLAKVARRFRMGIKRMLDLIEDDYRCDTQGWNCEFEGVGDMGNTLEVYTDTPQIEDAWQKYWGRA